MVDTNSKPFCENISCYKWAFRSGFVKTFKDFWPIVLRCLNKKKEDSWNVLNKIYKTGLKPISMTYGTAPFIGMGGGGSQ